MCVCVGGGGASWREGSSDVMVIPRQWLHQCTQSKVKQFRRQINGQKLKVYISNNVLAHS